MGFNCVDEEPRFGDLEDIINHQVMSMTLMENPAINPAICCFMFDDSGTLWKDGFGVETLDVCLPFGTECGSIATQ